MAEQFCLKWNNHQSTLISNFDSLLETQKHVDCSLAADGKVLRAHKVVLSACSPYLEQLLNHEKDRYPILVFSDVRYDYLKAMLDYMYRGEVNVLQEHLNGFLKAAETLQIKGLTDQGGGGREKRKGPSSSPPLGASSLMVDGSDSPTLGTTPAKRRRQRRPSFEQDSSHQYDSSNSCDIPSSVAGSKMQSTPLPSSSTPSSFLETDRLSSGPQSSAPQTGGAPPLPSSTVQPKLEPIDSSTTSVVQPKTEYIEEANDEQIEDLTLDDDDDDGGGGGYMIKPGSSSHGNDSQGFDTPWQFSGETSNPDMFLGTQQDPSGNQNNSQGGENILLKRESFGGAKWEEELHHCPNCGRGYRYVHNLERHKRIECGKEASLVCPSCPYRSKHKHNLLRHFALRHPSTNAWRASLPLTQNLCNVPPPGGGERRGTMIPHSELPLPPPF